MEAEDDKYVYHGSWHKFDKAMPKQTKRTRTQDGIEITIFDDISFHATPHRWIALTYTYKRHQSEELNGVKIQYLTGVSLYDHKKEVTIYGFESLEKSLEKLYGEGGYLYAFDKEKFFHTEGLGNLEMITREPLEPLRIERIADPVVELKDAGVTFEFIDLSKPENASHRYPIG